MLSKKEEMVLSYPKLKARIDSRDNPKAEQKKALKNLKEISADYSLAWIKGFEKFLDASLDKLYDGINFDEGGIGFEELVKEHNIVLVPNHQSHADYLAINYVFFKNFNMPLYVAGGINLNIFPIGRLFRKSGCFFIRRSFANDITYKLTLEAYLYYLLMQGRPVEFFFEGGRSRTGKLRPPRYGLYNMLIEAHQEVKVHHPEKKLLFVPTSIIHEYVPETKSLTKELGGGKKVSESASQVFGLVKLFAYQFGNIHISFGKPVEVPEHKESDLKEVTQNLAFKCFREVGKNMKVTPSSLLAMVLLDEPAGALMWSDILAKARAIRDYCEKFKVPHTDSLKGMALEPTLERTIDIFIGNKKVDAIGKHHHGHIYYSIREECRGELLYFKNTILHHFLVPTIINLAWVNLFRGQMNSVDDLKEFFLYERKQLKHEFYLPTVKEFFFKTLSIVSYAVGRKVGSLEELMELSQKEIYAIIQNVGVFGRNLSYILEGYYISALAANSLHEEKPDGFKMDEYQKRAKEIFEREIGLGRVIKYPESYSVPIMKSSMEYLKGQKLIENNEGLLTIVEPEKFDKLVQRYEKDLIDLVTFNIRVQ